MHELKINTNTKAMVYLTKAGRKILGGKYAGAGEEKVFSGKLWEIMEIFGRYFYNGCDIPFADNQIIIESDEGGSATVHFCPIHPWRAECNDNCACFSMTSQAEVALVGECSVGYDNPAFIKKPYCNHLKCFINCDES